MHWSPMRLVSPEKVCEASCGREMWTAGSRWIGDDEVVAWSLIMEATSVCVGAEC